MEKEMELYYHETKVEEFTREDAIYKQAVSIDNTHHQHYDASEHALIRNLCIGILRNAPFLRSLNIRYGNHTHGFLRRIFSALNKKHTIKTLIFKHDYYFEEGNPVEEITKLLKTNTTIDSLDLHTTFNVNVPYQEKMAALTELVKAGSRLKTLKLNIAAHDSVTRALQAPQLQELDNALINALANHPNLQILSFCHCNMLSFDAQWCAILNIPTLRSIEFILKPDLVSIANIETFFTCLQQNNNKIERLTIQYYSFSRLFDDDQGQFGDACCRLIQHNTTLKYLSLVFPINFNHNDTSEALRHAIATNTSLLTLKLEDIQNTVNGLAKAMEGLDDNTTLQKFMFKQESPCDDLSGALRSPLYTTNTTLSHLALTSIPSEKHILYMAHNTNLTHLDIQISGEDSFITKYYMLRAIPYSLVSLKIRTNTYMRMSDGRWVFDINENLRLNNTTLQELSINCWHSLCTETTTLLHRNKMLATSLFSLLYPVLEFYADPPAPLKRATRPSSSVITKKARKS